MRGKRATIRTVSYIGIMDRIVLFNRVLQYVSQFKPFTGFDYKKVASDLHITEDELNYAIIELGKDYFISGKTGFAATEKAVFEGKNCEIIDPLSIDAENKKIAILGLNLSKRGVYIGVISLLLAIGVPLLIHYKIWPFH